MTRLPRPAFSLAPRQAACRFLPAQGAVDRLLSHIGLREREKPIGFFTVDEDDPPRWLAGQRERLRGYAVNVVPLAGLYGLATFLFVVRTISALRPTPESRVRAHDELKAHGSPESLPIGMFFPVDGVVPSLGEEARRWNEARLHHVSTELVAINRGISATLERQFMALQAVYRGLKVLVVLAALLMAMVGVGWAMGGGDRSATSRTPKAQGPHGACKVSVRPAGRLRSSRGAPAFGLNCNPQ